jgi:hypothetical protein
LDRGSHGQGDGHFGEFGAAHLVRHGPAPHWFRQFKLSKDPKFVEKLEDIVGLYMAPPTPIKRPWSSNSFPNRLISANSH